jgi:hypothetical protein
MLTIAVTLIILLWITGHHTLLFWWMAVEIGIIIAWVCREVLE